MKKKQKWLEQGLLLVIILLMSVMIIGYGKQEKGFQKENADSDVRYVKAEVQEVLEQEMAGSGVDEEYVLGYQKLVVRIMEGEQKGQELIIDNYITVQHNVVLKEKSKVIVCIDCPEGVLFAAVTVASLGAVMDVAVSLGASLQEISNLNPHIGRKELFHSGMNIGKDMIGTMTNTLILAFAGGTLSTLLVFVAYGVQFHQFLSSNLLALEIAKGFAGSAAVVMTVPISAAVCALGYGENQQKHNGGN